MIRISVDVVWASNLLLKRLNQYKVKKTEEIYLSTIAAVNIDMLVNLAVICGWINNNSGQELILSVRGKEIIHKEKFPDQAKDILEDYIKYVVPAWSKRIPYGRKEAFIFMNKDEQACFYEAGLMKIDSESVAWWDNISNYIRNLENKEKNDIGRLGERATIAYETKRTGYEPRWISIESNLAGYDILSRESVKDESLLLIEVKSSEININHAEFYITSHEWHTACNSQRYQFYVWCFANKQKRLAIINPKQIQSYIPTNNRTGKWHTVRIPFVSFDHMFTEIA